MQENFTILKQRAPLERLTLPVILDCRTIHGILWVLQETFLNDDLLEKDEPLLSSTIRRLWHPLLKNGDLTLQEIKSDPRVQWDENRGIRQYLHHTSKFEVDC